jgi:glycosyltransferase involved in cell wall biosynthesis
MEQAHLPQISVIIPTFNRAWVLAKAIDSVLAQTFAPKEIIVVDDGSTDETRQLLAAYGDRLRVLTQPNKGVSAARNLGIRHSCGEYIALLDSDDRWEPEKLACQAEFFTSHPRAMICQTEEIWIRKGRRVNPMQKHQKPSGMIFEPSLHRCLVSPSAVMMKKKIFDVKGMFNENFLVCEDYDLWLRISVDMPVYLIEKPLTVKYGGHDDQLSASRSQDRYRIACLLDLIGSGSLNQRQKAAATNVLQEKCRIYGNGCKKRGKDAEALTYLGLYRQLSDIDFPGSQKV